jgi:hypothetical protein
MINFNLYLTFVNVLAFILISYKTTAQNVGINGDGTAPDNSAILDVKSSDKGVLIPRVQLDDASTEAPVTNPVEGLMIYNELGSEPKGFWYWTGSEWQQIGATSNSQIPVTDVQVDNSNYSFTTSWALGPVFNTVNGFSGNSKVKITYHMPLRNNINGWGGAYIEPQVSFDNGVSWQSLGSSGYDGGIMHALTPSIGSYFNTILIDPQIATSFSVKVRFYLRSFQDVAYLNQNHSINTISGTATLMPGIDGEQHYTKVIIEEIFQ